MKKSGASINLHSNRNQPSQTSGTKRARINKQIVASEVRLIGINGEQVGIVKLGEALRKAEEAELDLVEIAPQLAPPVCRIMDFGKYLFEQRKKLRKKSKKIQLKEIKLRAVTDVGDYLVKLKKSREFLKSGDKVKFSVKFRGRELAYQQQGKDILFRVEEDLKEDGVVEQVAKMEGKQMAMLIAPKKGRKS